MFSKNKLIKYFELINKKVMTVSEVARDLGISREWASKLYNRYKNNKEIYKQKGGRKNKLSEKLQQLVKDYFIKICIIDEDVIHSPSIDYINNELHNEYEDFPDVSNETIRKCLIGLDYYGHKERKRKVYKAYESKAVGMIVQGDVCEHRWVAGINDKYKLIMFIDDKSRYVLYAKFVENDNFENHIEALKEILKKYGKPFNIYYDNDPKYCKKVMKYNKEVHPAILGGLSDIDIGVINSVPYHPQGKGKIERKFRTMQRQIIFFNKKYNVTNIDEANVALHKYIEQHNRTRSRAINDSPFNVFMSSESVFKPLTKDEIDNLDNYFTHKSKRKVNKLCEISIHGYLYKVPYYNGFSLVNRNIEIKEYPNNWIKLFYNNHYLITYNLRSYHEKREKQNRELNTLEKTVFV